MSFNNASDLGDDNASITGGMFETAGGTGLGGAFPAGGTAGASAPGGRPGAAGGGLGASGFTREARVTRGYGRGPVPVDRRKFKYDVVRGSVMQQLSFGVSKADRLDPSEAGDLLDRIHKVVGIDTEKENVLVAFDKALFFEHTINGASLLQPGRGVLSVEDSEFDLKPIKDMLGVDQRRFFRAYADFIADVNREVIRSLDPHDPLSCDKFGQLMQVAAERGLQKYPHLAHDSSDAGVRLSAEERVALMGSKRAVLETTVNNVDKITQRAGSAAGA